MDTPKSEALRLANDVRRELGLSPQPRLTEGMRDIPDHCPLARTVRAEAERISVTVGGGDISVWVGTLETIGEPDHVFAVTPGGARFIIDFDLGLYPELVTEPGR